MNITARKKLILLSSIFFLSSFTPLVPVEKLSMVMTAKSLRGGKSITAKGEIYYQFAGGQMVTRFTSPSEYLVITNSRGEFKIYNQSDSTLTQDQGRDYSSENSFIYYFLNGKTQDMGLQVSGYRLKGTRFEDNLVITTWDPPAELSGTMSKAELAHENFKPIFLGFYSDKGKPMQKVFYSQYKKVGETSLPMSITEFSYIYEKDKTDSVITKRVYEDLKLNEQVDSKWLNFKIPANAKIIK